MCVTKCPALGRWINPFSWTLNVFTFSPDMCVELAHVFPSMGSRRLVTMLTYLAPLMVQSEKQALLPCSLYAFFLNSPFLKCWFQVICCLSLFLHCHSSSLCLHSISSLISITLLLKSLNAASNSLTSDVVSFCLSVSLGQTTFCSKLYSTLRCTHSKQPLPPSNILRMHIALIKKRQMGLLMWYTPCYFSLHTDGQSIHKPCSLCV